MKVHHFNAGTLCPDAILQGGARFVCNVLLLETADGLALVDTGLGTGDIADPERLGSRFLDFAKPVLDPEETALAQVRRLGFDPADVRHLLLTHLDKDHGGGIADFPHAQVHVHLKEHEAAMTQPPGAGRYVREQWGRAPQWVFYGDGGEGWFGFQGVRALGDREPDVLVIPLPGHTAGHCGIAVRSKEGWLLHAGDSFYLRQEIETPPRELPPGFKSFQESNDYDRTQRLANRNRLQDLLAMHSEDATIINSHEALA